VSFTHLEQLGTSGKSFIFAKVLKQLSSFGLKSRFRRWCVSSVLLDCLL